MTLIRFFFILLHLINSIFLMKRHIVNKFDKKKLPLLPRVVFPGKIIVVVSEEAASLAVDFLLTQKILGIDTETRPSFTRGKIYKVALLQVSTYDTCYLFRLNVLANSPSVKRLLEDTTVPKIGLSLHDDMHSLSKRMTFKRGWFIDLQDIIVNLGIEDKSLAKLYANIFGERISKREQLSNWEADVLGQKQMKYAATDAWVCINIYEEYLRLIETGDYELEIVPEEEKETAQNEKETAQQETTLTETAQQETTLTRTETAVDEQTLSGADTAITA